MAQTATITNSTTRIIPVDHKDQFQPVPEIRSRLFIVVPGSLDEHLLRRSLDTLIRVHIPILGARLRTNTTTKLLEYHLPEPFPESYQLYDWSPTAKHNVTLQDAGILLSSAPPDNTPSFGPLTIPELEELLAPPEWPTERTLEKPDCPLLVAHISSYTNGSVLSLNIPHSVCDQMGFGSIIKAWLQVAAGKQPEPFLALAPGELDGDANLSRAELKVKGRFRLLSKLEQILGTLGFIPEMIFNSKEVRRTLFLPANMVEKLRNKINETLKEKGEAIQVTNGDVVSALCLKLSQMARKSPRMFSVSASLNARGRHPALPADKPYLHNAVCFSSYRHSVDQHTPLFDLVVETRRAALEGLKLESISRCLRLLHEKTARGDGVHIVEPFELSYSMTSWSGAWRGLDFAPVTVPAGGVSDQNGAGDGKLRPPKEVIPVVLGHALLKKHPKRFNAQIMCKADGGYWCDFATSQASMDAVDELLKRDPSLESL